MAQEFTIKTWACQCGYIQDFEGKGCPSCGLKGGLAQVMDENKKIKVHLVDEAEIDVLEVSPEEKNRLKAQRKKDLAALK